jgi:hypothetical protein
MCLSPHCTLPLVLCVSIEFLLFVIMFSLFPYFPVLFSGPIAFTRALDDKRHNLKVSAAFEQNWE